MKVETLRKYKYIYALMRGEINGKRYKVKEIAYLLGYSTGYIRRIVAQMRHF